MEINRFLLRKGKMIQNENGTYIQSYDHFKCVRELEEIIEEHKTAIERQRTVISELQAQLKKK